MQIFYGKEFEGYCAGADIQIGEKYGYVIAKVWRFIIVRWFSFPWALG